MLKNLMALFILTFSTVCIAQNQAVSNQPDYTRAPLMDPKSREWYAGDLKDWKVCRQDRKKLCPESDHRSFGYTESCLMSNKAKLSQPCRAVLDKAIARAIEGHKTLKDCLPDHKKFCPKTRLTTEAFDFCMGANYEALSPKCRKLLYKE